MLQVEGRKDFGMTPKSANNRAESLLIDDTKVNNLHSHWQSTAHVFTSQFYRIVITNNSD